MTFIIYLSYQIQWDKIRVMSLSKQSELAGQPLSSGHRDGMLAFYFPASKSLSLEMPCKEQLDTL